MRDVRNSYSEDEVLQTCIKAMRHGLFPSGSNPVVEHGISYARSFFKSRNLFNVLIDSNVQDIPSATYAIITTLTAQFIQSRQLIEALYSSQLGGDMDDEFIKFLAPTLRVVQEGLDTFMNNLVLNILDAIKQKTGVYEPPEGFKQLMISTYGKEYTSQMRKLFKSGHNCLKCHLDKDRTECEIWNAINERTFGVSQYLK